MARNKTAKNQPDTSKRSRPTALEPLERLLAGDRAVYIYAAVFLVVTVLLFQAFLFGDGMLFGGDTIPDGIYTRQYYKDFHAENGGVPRWNPFILGGLPFVDAMHGDTFYPGAWLKFFMPLTRALGHKLVWHLLLAGLTMYAFLRTIKIRREAAFLGGLMYLLAPSFISLVYPGHDAKMYVIAWLPLAFVFLERLMMRPRVLWAALLGGVMGLLVLTSHVQMAYYSYWALGLYFLYRLITGGHHAAGTATRATGFVGAVALAVTLGAVQLLPAYTFTTGGQSVRAGEARTGYGYATSYSMHPEEVVGMVVPSFQGINFVDGRSGGRFSTRYWGRNGIKLNSEYLGILPMLFAVMALVMCRGRDRWLWLGIAILSLIYALGAHTPFYRLFYHFVPGVKNFRAPGMIFFLFCFAAVVLAARLLHDLYERTGTVGKLDRGAFIVMGGFIAAAVVMSVAGSAVFDVWRAIMYRGMPEDFEPFMHGAVPYAAADLWRIAIVVAAALAGARLYARRSIGPLALTVALATAIVVDQAPVAGRFITELDPATNGGTAPDAVVQRLRTELANTGPFRVLGAFSRHEANYYAMFGIQLADGFHNNELQSYEFFRGPGKGQIPAGWRFYESWLEDEFQPDRIGENPWLAVAGVRYLPVRQQDGTVALLDNPGALDRAFVVHDWTITPSDSAAVLMMGEAGFEPGRTATITSGVPVPFDPPGKTVRGSRVTALDYGTDTVEITADLTAPGLLVLTDNHVPYWTAMVDGEAVPINRAYGTFMAVACPQGEHAVTFTFRSGPFHTGRMLTLASIAMIVLLAAGDMLAGRLRRRSEPSMEVEKS
jgi:hypothetical protein